jgi:ABC-2 type transport system ATP-binding protein
MMPLAVRPDGDYPGPVEVSPAGTLAVAVRGLEKSYSGGQGVRGVDLEIRAGEVFALLGPNGAGKTTTIEILEGYRARDRGEVNVLGVDPGRHRARLKSHIGIVLRATAAAGCGDCPGGQPGIAVP